MSHYDRKHQHHEHQHVHVHAQHMEKDDYSSRLWLYVGIALLAVALVYSTVLLVRAKSRSATTVNLDLVQMQFDPAQDEHGIAVGDAKAPVTIREFADFQCPACGGFEPVMAQLRKDYVETGKVRLVFFDFPLENIHKNSVIAAQVARCAGLQDRYWQMHDMLYAKQAEWAEANDPFNTFVNYANALGMDGGKFMTCIRSGTMHQPVLQSESYGEALGLNSTPTIAVNDQVHVGGAKYEDLKTLIDQQLAVVKH